MELPQKRTATSDTFELEDGKRETRLYESSVNYKDEEGNWQPIEEGLEEKPGGAIVNGDNSFDLHLPESLGESAIRLSTGEGWVSERPTGIATKDAELEGETAVYEAPASGVSYEFSGLASGLKEDIVLADQSAPSTFHFLLEASEGLTPSLNDQGGIDFRDEAGKLISTLPAPVMSDSAASPSVSEDVHYSLQPTEGGAAWTLAVEADREWLQSPERVFPVRLDPTLTIPSPSLDCAIFNGTYAENNACGYTGWQTLGAKAAYKSSGADEYVRTLLRFDLSSIPSTASISSATLGLYSPSSAQNTEGVALWRVNNKAWNNTVNWNRYSTGNLWKSPGGDYGEGQKQSISAWTSQRGSGPGWWTFTGQQLAWIVEQWHTGKVPNQGFLLKLIDERSHVCCITRQVEWSSSAAANKPYLSVEYASPAPADSKVTSPTDGTTTARRFRLTAAWEHPGVQGVTFQYKGTEGWVNIPAEQVTTEGGKAVSWPLKITDPKARQSEALYWNAASAMVQGIASAKGSIRAVLNGQVGAGGYTPSVGVEINRDTGGPKDATSEVGPGSVDLLTGNYTVTRNDVNIPGYGGALEFSRSISSRQAKVEPNGVFGPGWKPGAPVEEAGGSDWRSIKLELFTENWEEENEAEEIEEKSFTYHWAALSDLEGGELSFEEPSPGVFKTPDEVSGFVLRKIGEHELALTDPSGNRTVFSNAQTLNNEYIPTSVSTTGGAGNKTRLTYEFPEAGKKRLKEVIAPAAPGVSCPDETAKNIAGCHVLTFNYSFVVVEGQNKPRLASITYYTGGSSWEVAHYEYNATGRLAAEWDPRISPSLKETYTYTSEGQLQTLTPPGQEPWTMAYGNIAGETADGRLISVKRPSLVAGNPTAQTTIAYGVPLSGSSAPYAMSPEAVAAWGQKDAPADATAIFPVSEVPSSPPAAYTRATVYYMDAEGQIVNVATPSGAGTSAPSITTTETDRFGNVVRELGAQNRLRALAEGAGSAAKSLELDTEFSYSPDGTKLEEEIGPKHLVKIKDTGETKEARAYRSVLYNDETPPAGEPPYLLPTNETTGALVSGSGVLDQRATTYQYNWTLRKPTVTTVDPEGLKIISTTEYNSVGQVTETRQPLNSSGGGAGTTKVVYYIAEERPGKGELAKCESNAYAGLPCKAEPAAQPGTEGQPQLLVKKFLSYNQLDEPLEISESPGGGSENVRRTVLTYDNSGRQTSKQIIGGGEEVPKVETLYSSANGQPTSEKFLCGECNNQAVSVAYDALGRPYTYEDADGNKAETTFDLEGRPVTTKDNKGSQTVTYDSVTGLPVELQDSAAGKFTASYDADGNLVSRTLPDGLTAETTYNTVDQPMQLTYTKASFCGASCTWLSFGLERSITGQIVSESGTLGTDRYGYDKAGRLTSAEETPQGGGCTTRVYAYDSDSNRTSLTTRPPGIGGACAGSGGTEKKYSYDSADRLTGSGITYDSFGRITSLPGEYAGGKTLTTSYFSNDMVATQLQNGVSNTFTLDASLRQRSRLQAGGLEGTEVFHYDASGDAPAWTERGSVWTRNIVGIGGELAAVQESGKEITLQLTNLHGDVSATAAISPEVTSLKGTFSYDEFGNPTSGSAGRYGWLGGKQRRTEFASGVIQMGARSYVPSLGRFLTRDPVPGGSANSYDYANQDPINLFDLAGSYVEACESPNAAWTKRCKRHNRREAREANKKHAIATHFKTRAGAEHFLHYLEHATDFRERIQKEIGEWSAKTLLEVRRRAAHAATPQELSHAEPSTCTDIGVAASGIGLGLTLAPETGGASVLISTVGFITAVTSAGDVC